GVAAIRGTDYDVSVELHDQQYTVHFTCISGTLIARSTVGTSFTVVLNTGETWTPGEREKQVVPVATLEELINLLSFWDGGEGKDLVRNVPVPTIDVITRIDPQTGSPNTSTLNIIP
ncbi:MAG: hypothetical protein JWN25_845, partial [Verrucomicrobiales bacterium]|nr:hypothetical protein [Verrucomicrobiales bacterium]